eukprot:COSAG02_NODE_3003_length_7572_cov_5.390740_4_plen_1475_part_01
MQPYAPLANAQSLQWSDQSPVIFRSRGTDDSQRPQTPPNAATTTPRAVSPRRSALRTSSSPGRLQRAGTPERRASFRDQSPTHARESSVADVRTFALSPEEKREKAAAAAPALAKAAEELQGSTAPELPAAVDPGGLPAGWEQGVSPSSGQPYFRNVVMDTSQWERPQYPVLPPGWTHGTSTSTGRTYYIPPNGESTYEPPKNAGRPFKVTDKVKKKGKCCANPCFAKPRSEFDPPNANVLFPPPPVPKPESEPEYGDITPKGEDGALDLAQKLRRELGTETDAEPSPNHMLALPSHPPQPQQQSQLSQAQAQAQAQAQHFEEAPAAGRALQPRRAPGEGAGKQLGPQLRLEPQSPPPLPHVQQTQQPQRSIHESDQIARLSAELARAKKRGEELERKQAALDDASLRRVQSELPPSMPVASPLAPESALPDATASIVNSAMVDEIWAECDTNGTGFLTKMEYKTYLQRVGEWGSGSYTEHLFDEQWPAELQLLQCSPSQEGVSQDCFKRVLYGVFRNDPAVIADDLRNIRASQQGQSPMKSTSLRVWPARSEKPARSALQELACTLDTELANLTARLLNAEQRQLSPAVTVEAPDPSLANASDIPEETTPVSQSEVQTFMCTHDCGFEAHREAVLQHELVCSLKPEPEPEPEPELETEPEPEPAEPNSVDLVMMVHWHSSLVRQDEALALHSFEAIAAAAQQQLGVQERSAQTAGAGRFRAGFVAYCGSSVAACPLSDHVDDVIRFARSQGQAVRNATVPTNRDFVDALELCGSLEWEAAVRLVICVPAPHAEQHNANVTTDVRRLDNRLRTAFSQLNDVNFCLLRTNDWFENFGGAMRGVTQPVGGSMVRQQHRGRNLSAEWRDMLDWTQILYQKGTSESHVGADVQNGKFWTTDVDTPDALVATAVALIMQGRVHSQRLIRFSELQQKLEVLRNALGTDGLRGLCLSEPEFKTSMTRLAQECEDLRIETGDTRQERALCLAELGKEVAQAVRYADPTFRGALSTLRQRCLARQISTWLNFFAATSFAEGKTLATTTVPQQVRLTRGMCIPVKHFMSGMRRLAHVSKSEVSHTHLVAITSLLDPLGEGFVSYGSFLDRVLGSRHGHVLMTNLQKRVFGHLQCFLRHSQEKETEWFMRHADHVPALQHTSGRFTSPATAKMASQKYYARSPIIEQALHPATMSLPRFQEALQTTGLFLTVEEIRLELQPILSRSHSPQGLQQSVSSQRSMIDAVPFLNAVREARRIGLAGFAHDMLEERKRAFLAMVPTLDTRQGSVWSTGDTDLPVPVQPLLELRCSVEGGTVWTIPLMAQEALVLGRGSKGKLRWDDASVAKEHCLVEACTIGTTTRSQTQRQAQMIVCKVECLGDATVYSEGVEYDAHVAPLTVGPGGHFFVNRVRIDVHSAHGVRNDQQTARADDVASYAYQDSKHPHHRHARSYSPIRQQTTPFRSTEADEKDVRGRTTPKYQQQPQFR